MGEEEVEGDAHEDGEDQDLDEEVVALPVEGRPRLPLRPHLLHHLPLLRAEEEEEEVSKNRRRRKQWERKGVKDYKKAEKGGEEETRKKASKAASFFNGREDNGDWENPQLTGEGGGCCGRMAGG